MTTCIETTGVQQIGEVAGEVWQTLSENGPTSFSKLAKEIEAPRDIVSAAVGWLAREEKVCFDESGRTRLISLV